MYPAHCRDQRTRVTRGKWHGYTPPGLPSCAAAELLKSKEAADSRAAAELARLKKSDHEEPGGAGGAGDAGDGKGPSAPRPKPPTAMEKEQALSDTLRSIRDRANELRQHDPEPAAYLTNVARLHCANPAFSAFYSAILLTMFRCHGRPQVALEHKIHGIFASVDQDKRTEFRSLITQLHSRVPPRPKPVVQLLNGTSASFEKFLDNLASADITAKVPKEDAPHVLPEIEAFVLGAVTVLRQHAATLQKKMNTQAYDFRATPACHLLTTGALLVEEIPDVPSYWAWRHLDNTKLRPPQPSLDQQMRPVLEVNLRSRTIRPTARRHQDNTKPRPPAGGADRKDRRMAQGSNTVSR